jgi:hypothetical protein
MLGRGQAEQACQDGQQHAARHGLARQQAEIDQRPHRQHEHQQQDQQRVQRMLALRQPAERQPPARHRRGRGSRQGLRSGIPG